MFTVIIPARYDSQRLPGKALIELAGKPMIQHVFERASRSSAADVVVATDDKRISSVVAGFGGRVCMTSKDHPTGTDRLQEAARILELADDDIVVNVQGDEPMIPAEVIEQVAGNLAQSGASMATLCEPITSLEDLNDPNIVKVVMADDGIAMYFSRAPIPFDRDQGGTIEGFAYRRHLGIYAYRVSFLNSFVTWPPSDLESIERLEQLRALSRGVRIHVADSVVSIPPGVDTAQDLERTRRLMEAT